MISANELEISAIPIKCHFGVPYLQISHFVSAAGNEGVTGDSMICTEDPAGTVNNELIATNFTMPSITVSTPTLAETETAGKSRSKNWCIFSVHSSNLTHLIDMKTFYCQIALELNWLHKVFWLYCNFYYHSLAKRAILYPNIVDICGPSLNVVTWRLNN